jgi:hypothetical protein
MKNKLRTILGAGVLLGTSVLAAAQVPYASATVEGSLAPGVYGRIEIGNAPPPPLIYAQPIIIRQPSVRMRQQPVYMHVPPGHAKNWSKHCGQYNACGYPVYFVRVDDDGRGRGNDDDQGKHGGKGHGNGHGNGKGNKHGG